MTISNAMAEHLARNAQENNAMQSEKRYTVKWAAGGHGAIPILLEGLEFSSKDEAEALCRRVHKAAGGLNQFEFEGGSEDYNGEWFDFFDIYEFRNGARFKVDGLQHRLPV